MRHWLNAAAVGLAWALCISAHAQDRRAPSLHHVSTHASGALAEQGHPLQDEQLEKLRGRFAVPTATQQADVILWDEPRKGLPPARTGADATVNGSVSTSFTIHSR
jgi:hypothetical protein